MTGSDVKRVTSAREGHVVVVRSGGVGDGEASKANIRASWWPQKAAAVSWAASPTAHLSMG